MSEDVLIVGAGLAGLCCAHRLQQAGVSYRLIDASDAVGGRVRTDEVDGFLLDRGFQVFLTSYPEAQRVLDYQALQLKPFLPGALVRYQGRFYELADPWRRPSTALMSFFSPIGSVTDKFRIAGLRAGTLRGELEDQFRRQEMTTLEALRAAGFSESIIDRFFRPFLGGIFLDPELSTSSRMLYFVFRMFSSGIACIPTAGMGAIPQQIAGKLRTDSIQLETEVIGVTPGQIQLASEERVCAKAVVVASDGPSAARLLGTQTSMLGQGVSCLYFSASSPPVDRPILVLNGDRDGPVNNLCVLTNASRAYAPAGKSLVSVTVLGLAAEPDSLLPMVFDQLREWYGTVVDDWNHLRTYSIAYALPSQPPPTLSDPQRPVRWQSGLYVCGDHRDNASIQGAMTSGRRAAEALLEDLGKATC